MNDTTNAGTRKHFEIRQTMNHFLRPLAGLATVSIVGVGSLTIAAPASASTMQSTTTTSIHTLSAIDCASLVGMVRAGLTTTRAASMSVATRQKLASVTTRQGCRLVTTGVLRQQPMTRASGLARSGCNSFYKTDGLYVGPYEDITEYVSVGMCWNGSGAWVSWGPDCWMGSIPIFGGGNTWCGVWNNGGWETTPGQNYYFFPYTTPWWHRTGYMRFAVYGNGYASSVWGSCCT